MTGQPTESATSAAILLVDDLEENLIALEALLRRDGLELLRARSGLDALEILLKRDVALALLDVQMPEMDGFELAELMRGTERTRHVPIIFLTAGAHDGQRVFRGYEVGAVDFLYKPLDPVLLNHKVTTFVDLYRQRIEREQMAGELREMLRLNETFVAAVSHDLRAALTTVVMGAEVLESEYSSPDALHTLARLRSSADRMSRMLDQLYDLARARVGGGIALERRAFDFRGLTERIVGEMRLSHPGRTIAVEFSGDSTVSAWDETRMAQVLSNLVGNALRHGAAGEPVRVRVRATPTTLQVEVHNAGEIAADIRPHLFDPFRRQAQVRRDSLGLGLYIVRQIVLAHGGTIDAHSSPAEGTTFVVQVPKHR